jgi:hypothetical protein
MIDYGQFHIAGKNFGESVHASFWASMVTPVLLVDVFSRWSPSLSLSAKRPCSIAISTASSLIG